MGDETTAIGAVLSCDVERTELLAEEAELLAQLEAAGGAALAPAGAANGAANGATNGTAAAAAAAGAAAGADGKQLELAKRLEAVSKRLLEIDAYGAEARAAAILAGLSFDTDMQASTRGPGCSTGPIVHVAKQALCRFAPALHIAPSAQWVRCSNMAAAQSWCPALVPAV